MKYSLIIPAWNEEAFIRHTIDAVTAVMNTLSQQGSHSGELIVVDNNSTDNTAEIATELGAKVVFEPVNQISRARNRGASHATGEALVFLDADTTCTAILLAQALERLEEGTVVGGGSTIQSNKTIGAVANRGIRIWNYLSVSLRTAAGCFLYCRRDAFEAIGGFSERVYAGEEIFLSRQLKRWGKRHRMRFDIINTAPVTTSVRKLDWYTPLQLTQQASLLFIPGAVFSKRLCRTWYEDRERKN